MERTSALIRYALTNGWKLLLCAASILFILKTYGYDHKIVDKINAQCPPETAEHPNVLHSAQDNSKKSQKSIENCPLKKLLRIDWDTFLDTILFRKEVYLSFNVSDYTPDLQGWTNIDKLFEQNLALYLKKNPNIEVVRLVEVGSWKGRSSVAMASICRRLTALKKKKCTLLSIDSWTGSVEHFLPTLIPLTKRIMKANDGLFRLFEIFLKNVKVKQLDDVIVPLRLPSISAAQLLHCYQLKADMVYIDAAHDYESVQSDLAHYDGIVKVGGIIFGDDYKWSGVRRAVNEFAQQKQLIVLADHNTWVIQK